MQPVRVRAGERWRLVVRLKRPHGSLNPGGFDYEAWLLENGMRATGYVRPVGNHERLDAFVATPRTVVARLRENLRARLRDGIATRAYPGIALALTVGDRRRLGLIEDRDVRARVDLAQARVHAPDHVHARWRRFGAPL